MRDVAVAGVGMARFGYFPEIPLEAHGIEAARTALADAGLRWKGVEAMYCGSAAAGLYPGSRIGHALGLTGAPIVNVENASASGSTAFREAYLAVGEGRCDVALAVGVGKMSSGRRSGDDATNAARALPPIPPAAGFAMRARRRMFMYGTERSTFARVAVKNRHHGALNPYAQFQDEVDLDGALSSPMVADPLRVVDCCPRGDGGAAAVLTTTEIASRGGPRPLIRVMASAFRSELYSEDPFPEWELTSATARAAYEQAGVGPEDLDLVQVHDAFSNEEIEYYEALGLCPRGEGDRLVIEGETAIGGRIPFNTDGGLLARGHPLGPTGLAQVWETTLQLRDAAGPRQVDGARVGLLQMIGAGSVCIVHVLQR